MTASQRNATARKIANRDPVAVADFALRSEMLSDTLQEWFDTMDPVLFGRMKKTYPHGLGAFVQMLNVSERMRSGRPVHGAPCK